MKKPLIGITLDSQESGNYSKFPWYAIRENYLNCVYEFGAIPFPLFHNLETINEFSKKLDGLLITGGNFDINPKLYNESTSKKLIFKKQRTDFELKLFKKFLKLNKPVLGICGGEQLINVACGGSLIQNLNKKNSFIEHEQSNPRNEVSHSILIKKKTNLFKIIKTNKISVNSAHHQAVKKLGKNLIVSATSQDNVVEAIEHVNHPWCIGVQWHPEFLITKFDILLIKNFISFASK